MAMLASPNGVGVAKLLSEHKDQLGKKWVSRITVWKTDESDKPMMLFHVENVPAGIGAAPGQHERSVDRAFGGDSHLRVDGHDSGYESEDKYG